jgi:hypothetical protein
MTSTMDGQSNGHGVLFMGAYVRLFGRKLRFDIAELIQSAELDDIRIEPDAFLIFFHA